MVALGVKEVLFERPYIVHSGADLIAAIANGVDPSTIQAMAGGMELGIKALITKRNSKAMK